MRPGKPYPATFLVFIVAFGSETDIFTRSRSHQTSPDFGKRGSKAPELWRAQLRCHSKSPLAPPKATLSGAPGNRTPIFCMQNRCLPVGRAPHFIFFFSTPPRIRTLTYWFGISSATVTPRAFIHQFFVFRLFKPNFICNTKLQWERKELHL